MEGNKQYTIVSSGLDMNESVHLIDGYPEITLLAGKPLKLNLQLKIISK